MAAIYIVAGPPGIGKSTSGREFLPDDITILDADLVAYRYRQQGSPDYNYIGNLRYQYMLNRELMSGNDFAVELNLGFKEHYDNLRNLMSFSSENRIEVILFHTDDLQLCLDRARERHEEGLHLVPPETVREMYHNTIPLLKKNMDLISRLTAIDVKWSGTKLEHCLEFDRLEGIVKVSESPARWLDRELLELLGASAQKQKAGQSLKAPDSKIGNPRKRKRVQRP